MNSLQLESVVKKMKCNEKYIRCEVLAADELPLITMSKPCFYIVNIDNSNKQGSHWVVFHFPEYGVPEFFDSLGNPPKYYNDNFVYFFIRNNNYNYYKHNNMRLQDYNSKYCGQYCLYYIQLRCRGISYMNVLSQFSNVLRRNDTHIERINNSSFL